MKGSWQDLEDKVAVCCLLNVTECSEGFEQLIDFDIPGEFLKYALRQANH